MKRYLLWLDENLIALFAGFLLIFIPLWPKIPLADLLYGYNVRLRLDDIAVALACGVFLIQLIRRKVKIGLNPVTIGLVVYLIFGLLSMLSAVFLTHTVPEHYLHVAKTAFHWVRRIEYFSLFFILFGSIKSIKVTKALIILFFVTLLGVIIYGYGQKYLYWPAFSTMNREFSKGWTLYLTEHARVLSTFGGHYDLAAYLVIALTLGWSFFFGLKNKVFKISMGILVLGGFWLLILTASRISFIAYLIGLTFVVFLWTFKKGLGWGISRWLLAVTLSIFLMLSFGDLSSRFMRVLRLDERLQGIRQIALVSGVKPPTQNAVFLDNTISGVTSQSDQPPTPVKPLPGDVTGKEEPLLVPVAQEDGTIKYVQKQRTYSDCAVKYDLSTCIRLEATWPRAIRGWLTNPLLGSGYATLTKEKVEDFTEAESTDSDYFRSLGETGILGFAAFFGTILFMIILAVKSLGGIKDNFLYSLTVGFIGLSIGILANAVLIDIFEASKVAYIFWGVSGLTIGTLYLFKKQIEKDKVPLRIPFSKQKFLASCRKLFTSDKFWVTILLILAFWARTYKLDDPVADWHSWRQADTSAVTRNFVKQGSINWLFPTYDDLSNIASGKDNPNGYRFVEFPIYNASTFLVKKVLPELNVESAGHATTALISTLSVLFIFLLVRKVANRRTAYISAAVFAFIPYSIYYGRSILPDPTMVSLSLGSIYFALRYTYKQKIYNVIVSVVLATLALLVKPYAAFLLAPIVYIFFVEFRFTKKFWLLLLLMSMSLVPFIGWRFWENQFPEGIPANSWLFNGDGIRFKGAFWFWLFADRIGRLILGYWGLVLLGFGLVVKPVGKFKWFPLIFLATSLSYLFVLATGNVRHDYYQILIVPSLAIMVGIGLEYMLFNLNTASKILAIVCSVFMLAFGWYFVKDLYNINHPEIVEAGRAVQELTKDNGKIIAPYQGDTAFLYQTSRKGWPIMEGGIEDMIKKGADYYVSINYDDLTNSLLDEAVDLKDKKFLMENNKVVPPYTILAKTDKYVIIQLVPDKFLPQ